MQTTRTPVRSYLLASVAFVTLGLTLSTAADAKERMARTPYGQSKEAVDAMSKLVRDLDQDVDARLLEGQEGPAIDCLQTQRTTATTLRDLAMAERARLVEALADGDQAAVAKAHRNVMLWHVKAKVASETAGECAADSRPQKKKKRRR